MDKYISFKDLKRVETDYFIERQDRNSHLTILAPHGGNIEPHTSEIARLVAADRYNLFCFHGQKKQNNHVLHITSHRYDEEQALALVRSSAFVITIHGCTQKDAMVFIGGRYEELKKGISAACKRANLSATICLDRSPYRGQNPANICNGGMWGKGIQLEISRPLRDSREAWRKIAAAIHEALAGLNLD